jgi:protein-S-isoprenylcysteine O-methyltransferase Ste14
MDTARRLVAFLLLVALPPSLLLWIAIHPVARFWRRLGAGWTYGLLSFPCVALMGGIWAMRRRLLGDDLGTSWALVAAATACAALATLIARKRGRLLTFSVLAGLPELSPRRYPGRLLTEGIYARIRHPRYVEVVVGVLAYALFANHVGTYVLWLLLLPTLLLVVRLEERELRERFGDAWEDYARRVPRFLPRRRRAAGSRPRPPRSG